MVPEPSLNFKKWMTSQKSDPNTPEIRKPRELFEFGFKIGDDPVENPDGSGQILTGLTEFSWDQINEDNYADLAAEYGAEVEGPLAVTVRVGSAFSGNPGSTGTTDPRTSGDDFEIEIPEGYECDSVTYYFSHLLYGSSGSGLKAYFSIGGEAYTTNSPLVGHAGSFFFNTATKRGTLGISVATRDVSSFAFNVVANCRRAADVYELWQQQTYMAILTAYYKRIDDYNNSVAAANVVPTDTEPTDFRYNPAIGRAIEQRELKRLCIELMLEPYFGQMGLSHYDEYDNCRAKINATKNCLNRHATYVQFMEDAFDWDIFSYQFFPYYWANVCEWKDLVKQKSSSDPLFEAFLQSGMAKVTLPIKADYEFQVLYFMESGLIWNVNSFTVLPEVNAAYESIKVDLEIGPYIVGTDQLCPESCWTSRVPTALTIIQTNSAPLNANGLPCHLCEDGTEVHCEDCDCSGCSSLEGTPIGTGNNVLAGLENSGGGPGLGSSGAFLFPKHSTLCSHDTGKLVMNDGDGEAKVYQLGAPTVETTGHWILKLTDLGGLTADSTITVINDTVTLTFDRATWRNGSTPADAAAELGLIKTYMEGETSFDYMTLSIVNDELVIIEDTFDSTEITLEAWPVYSLEVVVASQEAQVAEPTGFPLGKLINISGDNAIISSELVETYQLESAFTVTHSIFNSGFDFDLANDTDLAVIVNHIMVPAADGKVKPLVLTANEIIDHRDFINSKRTQFVGVAISTNGMEVTVMRFSYLSFLTHGLRRLAKKGLFAHEDVVEA